ncbi:MAG: HlyD family secretion protein [Gammaproteobacteria bacterium]|nr:MAG: HlyD family secretion protein [Gammaproteobacteria bacterium]RKZ66147.1 MAG: HlyD family secretion protein [Gammaproteobacteria bacterium]
MTTDQEKEVTEEQTETETEQQATETQDDESSKQDPVRRTTLFVFIFCMLLFVWYVAADRHAPWTDQARVQGFIIPVTPKVSGNVIKVNVVADQVVGKGDLLLEIDPADYEIALRRAESNLELAGQDVGAGSANIDSTIALLSEAKATLKKKLSDLERAQNIYNKDPGAMSEAEIDRRQAGVEESKSKVTSLHAEVEKAKQQAGSEGEDNAKIRDARAALKQAQINLAETKLYAPSDGGITNLTIDEGYYANTGTPLMTFISGTDVWVKAYLRENSLSNLKIGDEVEILLDVAPGKIFKGEVSTIGYGISQPSGGAAGELETVKADSGWLRDAQRFPVIIKFSDDSSRGIRRHGGQADVQIYTGDHFIVNILGRIWIRLMSYLSYVY